MFIFYRTYIADLRYHNPGLKIVRQAREEGPLVGRIVITGKGEKSVEGLIL